MLHSWIKRHLGSVAGIDVDALKKENEELKKQNSELTQKVDDLTKKVLIYLMFISWEILHITNRWKAERIARNNTITYCDNPLYFTNSTE